MGCAKQRVYHQNIPKNDWVIKKNLNLIWLHEKKIEIMIIKSPSKQNWIEFDNIRYKTSEKNPWTIIKSTQIGKTVF